jgi:KUP system potassium uptake protein
VQQFGTAKIAFVFAPSEIFYFITYTSLLIFFVVSFIWFLILIGTGIYNITFFPGIFRAFDPSRAVLRKSLFRAHSRVLYLMLLSCFLVFIRTKDFELLAGVLLALTGCEALFAKFVDF